MVSLATDGDRTLFFDLLPLDLGSISGFQTKFQLYTVPGQIYYDATRKLVLKGADGVVFVADSKGNRQDDNVESFRNLQTNLLEQGVDPREFPICFQYNKRDLPDAASVGSMDRVLNYRVLPRFTGTAARGDGVFETLRGITELVLRRVATRIDRAGSAVL